MDKTRTYCHNKFNLSQPHHFTGNPNSITAPSSPPFLACCLPSILYLMSLILINLSKQPLLHLGMLQNGWTAVEWVAERERAAWSGLGDPPGTLAASNSWSSWSFAKILNYAATMGHTLSGIVRREAKSQDYAIFVFGEIQWTEESFDGISIDNN